jgi:beta-N-acetylhexosaminidase
MLIIGLAGASLSARERELLVAPNVSGVILFARNVVDRPQVQALVADIRAVRDELLVCVDQEGGPVQRLREGFTALPALARLGERYDHEPAEALQLAEEHAWVMASELRAVDIDFSFAPVIDLARGNAAIGQRAFHADPEVVGELGQAYVRGLHLAGVGAVLKHFPGHGTVAADTHKSGATDPRSLAELGASDMLPFARCIEARAEAVMVAHVVYPLVDHQPAGFSRVWIEGILRGELGFTGAVISDDISMAAAATAGGAAARVHAHLDAGCDLVLACFPDVVEAAVSAVRERRPANTRRIAALRGEIGATWQGLEENPQRDRFIARVTELENEAS